MKELKLGSLFDGIGGFPLAASRYGIKTVWASEIEPFPIKVTKIRLPDMKHLGDITEINGAEIEPVDIITFGSPCQDLSVAGKRAGLAGERSGLFMEAVRIIKEMRSTYEGSDKPIQPRFAVWENVPGAFSSNKGEDFRAVLEEICRVKDETVIIPKPPKGKWSTVGAIMGSGYSIAWRILDAQYWGVPQRRRRIFLVADFGGQSAPEILFKRKGLSRHLAESRKTREGIATDAERSTRTAISVDTSHADDVVRISDKTIPALQSRSYKGGNCVAIENHPADSRVKLDESGTVQTLTTRMGTGGGNVPLVQGYRMTAFGEYADDDSASTVKMRDYKDATDLVVNPIYALDRASFNQGKSAQYDFQISEDDKTQTVVSRGPNAVAEPPRYSVRRLTPLECERLQGFPDGWTDIEGASDSARYKALGNSVAIPCVEYVMEGIAQIESTER